MAYRVIQAAFAASLGPVSVSFVTPTGPYGVMGIGAVITAGAPSVPVRIYCDAPVPGSPNSTVNVYASDAFTGTATLLVVDLPNGPSVQTLTPGPLALDFTAGVVPAQITASRASGNIYLMQSAATYAVNNFGATPAMENRGDGAGSFLWSFPSYTNAATAAVGSAFIFNSGWTKIATGVVTDSSVVAPDGTLTAAKVNDTDGTNVFALNHAITSNMPVVMTLWEKDDGGSLPTAPGMFYSDGTGVVGLSFATQATWRRVTQIVGTGADTSPYAASPAIAPAGIQPGPVLTGSATGAIDVAGYSQVSAVDYPLVDGTAAAQDHHLNTAFTQIVQNGDLVLEIVFRHFAVDIAALPSGYVFSAASPDGLISLQYTTATQTWTFGVKGSTVLTTTMGVGVLGSEIKVHLEYRPSVNTSLMRVAINGAVQNQNIATGTTGGSAALSAITSLYLGSNIGASFGAFGFTRLQSFSAPATFSPEVIVLGDSIMSWTTLSSLYNCVMASGSIYTISESRTRAGIISLATPGDKAEDQLSRLSSYVATLSSAQKLAIKGVLIQVGVNNIFAGGQSAATASSHIQDLITAARAAFTNAKVVEGWITPGKGAYGSTIETVRLAVNQNISGTGSNNLTGIDQVVTANASQLDDGSGNTIAIYGAGDGIHINTLGKSTRMVPPLRTGLTAAGVLP